MTADERALARRVPEPGEHEVTIDARDLCGRHLGSTIAIVDDGQRHIGTLWSVKHLQCEVRVELAQGVLWVPASTPVTVPAETEL